MKNAKLVATVSTESESETWSKVKNKTDTDLEHVELLFQSLTNVGMKKVARNLRRLMRRLCFNRIASAK